MACPGKKFFFFLRGTATTAQKPMTETKMMEPKTIASGANMYRFQVPGDDAARYATISESGYQRVEGGICIHTI